MLNMHLYDAHNHLQDDRFAGQQERLITEARARGVLAMVVNGSTESDWPAVADLARRFPGYVLPSFGYHPWYVHERSPDWLAHLQVQLEAQPSFIGEIGLDRWKKDLPWEGQEEVFLAQLDLASTRNLPVSIHCLKAWGRLVELLETHPCPERGFLLHSYGGSVELVERLAPLGAYFSLPGYFAHPGKERRLEPFRHVPLDRLLIETDAPDQGLPPERELVPLADPTGHPLNHPANLPAVYRLASELLEHQVEDVALQVEANFRRFFGVWPGAAAAAGPAPAGGSGPSGR